MRLLTDKTAIITGASSGIGRAAALLFAGQGARLVLVARRANVLEELCDEIAAAGGHAFACPGDVCDPACHDAAVAIALKEFGQLDIAFNNAGAVGPIAPLAAIEPEDWNAVISVNLTAAFLAARAQVPAMTAHGSGSLIFTSSFVGNSVGLPGMGAYASAKAGLAGLVKSLCADYAHLGIRTNALLPGGTDTPMAGGDENKEWAAALHPMRRIAQPEEVAQAALFLASDMASFVNGSQLWADGGNGATKVQAP